MPELPEVEHARRQLAAWGGARIDAVFVADDPKVLPEPGVEAALRGARVAGAGRWGKHLWIETDRRPWVLLHLGMSGALREPDDRPIDLESSPATLDRSWPPRFTRLRLVADDGRQIALTDPRRFARVRLRHDPRSEPPVAALGPDPLRAPPDAAAFALGLRRRGPVKAALLDQRFCAGVGNWVADEVLFQARVAPQQPCDRVGPVTAEALRVALLQVVATAVAADARQEHFPPGWLFGRRWGKRPHAEIDGHPIRFDTVAGRTSAWVPALQRQGDLP